MRYMLLICGDESSAEHAADDSVMAGCGGWAEEMERRGVLQAAAGLALRWRLMYWPGVMPQVFLKYLQRWLWS